MADEEDRIALFVDFENLAIGARERGGNLDMRVIVDALAEFGVTHIEMPATPERVWRAIHRGGDGGDRATAMASPLTRLVRSA